MDDMEEWTTSPRPSPSLDTATAPLSALLTLLRPVRYDACVREAIEPGSTTIARIRTRTFKL